MTPRLFHARSLYLLLLAFLSPVFSFSQSIISDSLVIRKFFDIALEKQQAYADLVSLCTQAPARLSGSLNYEKAVEITAQMLRDAGADTVYLQQVEIPHWERGEADTAWVIAGANTVGLRITALGGSVGTEKGGLTAKVIVVDSLEALPLLGEEKIKGKIVFFNERMNPKYIDVFSAYGGCAGQRVHGATEAAKYGAVGVLVRSLTLGIDQHPHTGVMIYKTDTLLPAAAISTADAELLAKLCLKNPDIQLHIEMDCKRYPNVISHNVIGEIRGSEHPEEVILFGGHLDSWDNSQGAHDDGAGCAHAIEVIRLFYQSGVRPKHTIRCVLWANEENGAKGAEGYAAAVKNTSEKQLVAIESDRGGFTPRGFTVDGNEEPRMAALARMQSWEPLFRPYFVQFFDLGGSGVDVSRLRDHGAALIGFIPDSQRYFDFHHAETDRVENVNPRELELGAASIAALVYLFDTYGLYDSK